MSVAARTAGGGLALVAGLRSASQAFAWTFQYSPALAPALRLGEGALYWPWTILVWRPAWPGLHEASFSLAMAAGARIWDIDAMSASSARARIGELRVEGERG